MKSGDHQPDIIDTGVKMHNILQFVNRRFSELKIIVKQQHLPTPKTY